MVELSGQMGLNYDEESLEEEKAQDVECIHVRVFGAAGRPGSLRDTTRKHEPARRQCQEQTPILARDKGLKCNEKRMVSMAVDAMEAGGLGETRLWKGRYIADIGVGPDDGTQARKDRTKRQGDKDRKEVTKVATGSGSEEG
ncbi:hypothetical protein NDU88_002768 [Pleurodeles waltl]|uniref:Uncharacterized protein n=1 Tax=Pleurodeles waltl TaxID=8319 RepID=A0AAV7Q7N1_PLEWA|nr:hypothetical protein NDU88_002768 [Pleurodeles waltl]